MGFLNILFYVIALIIIGGFLWYILKMYGPGMLRDVKQGDEELKSITGKKGYKVLNVVWIIFVILIVLYMMGKCSQEQLGI